MKIVTIDDAQLRCEHLPRPGAPALLLINSLGTSLEMWDEQLPALSERYELIRFDKRGHGQSTLGSKRELTMDQLARDALAVLDACGVARAHLCGLSIGGMIAMQMATSWPDRVLKLLLCSTSLNMPPRDMWQTRIDTVRTQGMSPLVEPTLARWFTEAFRNSQPEKVEPIRRMLQNMDPDGYIACMSAIRDMDQRETIKTITAKTLVISGEHDPATTPTHAALIASSIRGAGLKMLDAAHLLNIEQVKEFNHVVVEFLAAWAGADEALPS